MNALILVDIQNDFLPGGALAVPNGSQILPIVNALLACPFDSVAASKDWHPHDHGSFAASHGKAVGEQIMLRGLPQQLWPVHAVQGTFGAEFSDGLDIGKIHKTFYKGADQWIDSYSAFFDNGHNKSTGLAEYLRKQGVKDLYLVGLATDYCVKYSVLDALKLRFNTFVVVDACRGVDLQTGDSDSALVEIQSAGATLVTSEEVLEGFFGVVGFEPTTSSSRTKHASQTALHPGY